MKHSTTIVLCPVIIGRSWNTGSLRFFRVPAKVKAISVVSNSPTPLAIQIFAGLMLVPMSLLELFFRVKRTLEI